MNYIGILLLTALETILTDISTIAEYIIINSNSFIIGITGSLLASFITYKTMKYRSFKQYKIVNAEINEMACKQIAHNLRKILIDLFELQENPGQSSVGTKKNRHYYLNLFCKKCKQDEFKNVFYANLFDTEANNNHRDVTSSLNSISHLFYKTFPEKIYPIINSDFNKKLNAYKKCLGDINRCKSNKVAFEEIAPYIVELSKIKNIFYHFEKGKTFENI